MNGVRLRIAGIALVALAILPASALATTDRSDYAAQANAVCSLAPGSDLAELAKLRSVAPAPGDEGAVSSWLNARERRLDLDKQLTKIDRQVKKLNSRTKRIHSIETLMKIDRKVRKLDHRAAGVQTKLIDAEDQDDLLGTALGATACVIDIQ
jgi:hypothetical protein